MKSPKLSDKAMREIEDGFINDREAHELLAIIVAEFNSDPKSTQCFDASIVERARLCVKKKRYSDPNDPYNGIAWRTGKLCVKGCGREAGTAWSPFFCPECNAERMRYVDKGLREIADLMGGDKRRSKDTP